MRTIKLKQGDEVTINGYIVRAVGLEEGKADQLQISRPGTPGLCDDVVVGYVIRAVGLEGKTDLLQISGYSIVVGLDPTTLPGKRRKEKK